MEGSYSHTARTVAMEHTEEEKKDRKIAILVTLFSMVVIVIATFFLGLEYQDPPIPKEEIEIELAWAGSASAAPPTPTEVTPTPAANPAQDVATQEAESISIPVANNDAPPKDPDPIPAEPDPEPAEPTIDEDLANAENDVWNTKPADGDDPDGGEEDGQGNGPGHGVFGGNGSGWSLDGRGYLGDAVVAGTPSEAGIVVLNIIVGTNGKVIRSAYNGKLSTTTSNHLIKLAQDAAKKARFSTAIGGSPEQQGTMTFVFELK